MIKEINRYKVLGSYLLKNYNTYLVNIFDKTQIVIKYYFL